MIYKHEKFIKRKKRQQISVEWDLAVLVGQQQPDQARGVAALPGQGDEAQLQRLRAHQPRLVLRNVARWGEGQRVRF